MMEAKSAYSPGLGVRLIAGAILGISALFAGCSHPPYQIEKIPDTTEVERDLATYREIWNMQKEQGW